MEPAAVRPGSSAVRQHHRRAEVRALVHRLDEARTAARGLQRNGLRIRLDAATAVAEVERTLLHVGAETHLRRAARAAPQHVVGHADGPPTGEPRAR